MNVMARFPGPDAHEPQPFKLRFENYEMLDRAGAFEDRRVELIEGMLIEMSPQQTPHSYPRNGLNRRLWMALDRLELPLSAQAEVTLRLDGHSAPDPDIVLTSKLRGEAYIPLESVALVVEVADTSLRQDLGVKRTLYAAAGISEYWVVDVKSAELHQFWAPEGDMYSGRRSVPLDGPIASATLPGLTIDGYGIL